MKKKKTDEKVKKSEKLIDFPENNEIEKDEQEQNSGSIKKKMRIVAGVIFSIVVIVLLAYYTTNEGFRSFVDLKILGKQITEDSIDSIEISSEDDPTIFAYDEYIGIFAKNTLNLYNSKATSVQELNLNITTPIIDTEGEYAVIAESNGNKFYVIKDTNIAWQGKVDGDISKININENGYVSVIVTTSTYNSIVILFDSSGNELFKTYMQSTYAMCTTVSTDNSYMAIGEIDYSGTVLKSYVRIMDISTAEKVYTYSTDNNNIITNIKYCDKENVICVFTDSVVKVSSSDATEIYTISDDTYFVDIEMTGVMAVLEKQSSGLFSYEYDLKLISLTSSEENLYILDSALPKTVVANEKLIILNYGNEVDIVNSKGTLKKNYVSNQQIKDVVVGKNIVGIVYKDKIKVVGI